MDNLLITGISGFIGSSLAKKIIDKYPEVNIYGIIKDNPSIKTAPSLYQDLFGKITVIGGDITDYNLIYNTITNFEIDIVINMASISIVRICEENPLNALYVNTLGTGIIAEAVRNCRTVKHFITMSSDKSYGTSYSLPYREEETPLKGTHPYETTKTLCDIWCQMYQKNYKTPITVIRSANVFGPGDMNLSRLVPQVCINLANNKNPWLWSGVSKYVREFIYIDDVIDFILNLISKGKEIPELIPECYNLGSGNVFTIEEFANKFVFLSGKNLQLELKEKELNFKEIPEQYLSLTKTREKLEWNASYINEKFDEALISTYNYYCNYVETFEK